MVLWIICLVLFAIVLGWVLSTSPNGIVRRDWILVGTAAASVSATSLLVDAVLMCVLAAAIAVVCFVMASYPPGVNR